MADVADSFHSGFCLYHAYLSDHLYTCAFGSPHNGI